MPRSRTTLPRWRSQPRKSAARKPGKAAKPSATVPARTVGALPVQQGAANFKVSGASLTEVVRMLSSKALPLDKLNATAAVNGTVNVAWRESITRATAELALDATAPAQSATNQLPVSGALRGRYDVHSGLLGVSQLNLATPHSEANASGELGSRDVAVEGCHHYQQPAGVPAVVECNGPVVASGRTRRQGQLQWHDERKARLSRHCGTPAGYRFQLCLHPGVRTCCNAAAGAVRARWNRFCTSDRLRPEPPPQPEARRVHIDSLAGDVQYGRTAVALHNGVIEQGSAHLNVDGSATLEDGTFTANSPFEVQASIHNASVARPAANSGHQLSRVGHGEPQPAGLGHGK